MIDLTLILNNLGLFSLAILFGISFAILMGLRKRQNEEDWEIHGEIQVVIRCQKCNKEWKIPRGSEYFVGYKIPTPCECGGEKYVEKIFFEPKIEEMKKNKLQKYEELFR